MKHGLIAAIASVAVLVTGFSPASAITMGVWNLDDDDYGQRDEINETYNLSDGAQVSVNDIAGPVEIETWDGETAEVHIVRSARSAADLEHKKIIIEHSPSRLAIFTEPTHGDHWNRVQMRQSVTLKLPRRVGLQINDIAGHVRIGQIDGALRINDIAGAVDVRGVGGAPHINDIAGPLTIAVSQIGAEGMRINDIAGRVELVIASGIDADVDISDISGHIGVEVPNVSVIGKIDPESFHGKIGNGGPTITISDIAGSVTVRN